MSDRQLDGAERIVQQFYKTVGIKLGLYNPHSKSFRGNLLKDARYLTSVKAVRDMIQRGEDPDEILRKIQDAYEAGVRDGSISKVLGGDKKDVDLVVTQVTYYHPQMYMEGGKVRKSYKLSELTSDTCRRLRIGESMSERALIGGALRWLLSEDDDGQGLDEVLYAIDVLAREGQPVTGRNFLRLMNHALEDAEVELKYLHSMRGLKCSDEEVEEWNALVGVKDG
jgi:hypothetical protein